MRWEERNPIVCTLGSTWLPLISVPPFCQDPKWTNKRPRCTHWEREGERVKDGRSVIGMKGGKVKQSSAGAKTGWKSDYWTFNRSGTLCEWKLLFSLQRNHFEGKVHYSIHPSLSLLNDQTHIWPSSMETHFSCFHTAVHERHKNTIHFNGLLLFFRGINPHLLWDLADVFETCLT